MSSKDFPAAPLRAYPVSEWYFDSSIDSDTYKCSETVDHLAGYTNGNCIVSGAYSDGHEVIVTKAAVTACGDLDTAYCARPVELYDGTPALVNVCLLVDDACAAVAMDTELVRPLDGASRSEATVNSWYVGDATYGIGTIATCDDSIDDFDGYMNYICTNAGAIAGSPAYCKAPENPDELGEGAFDCTAVTCDALPFSYCTNDIDLYTIVSDVATYSTTCVAGDNVCVDKAGGDPTEDPVDINFHPPEDDSMMTDTTWWYVGSSVYTEDTSFDCSTGQDVGSNTYINVLCDPDFTGAITSGDTITCEKSDSKAPTAKAQANCSYITCATMPKEMCSQSVDLYEDYGEGESKYIATCTINEAGDACDVTAGSDTTTPTPDTESNATPFIATIALYAVMALF